MNKLLTKVAKLVLGLSLAAGVGVAVGTGSKASRVDAAEEVIYTVSSKTAATKSSGTIPSGASLTYANSGSNGNDQMVSGVTETWTIKGYSGYQITDIQLELKRNSSNGAGNVSIKNGSSQTNLAKKTSFSKNDLTSTYTYYDVLDTAFDVAGDVVILLTSTQNSFWCDKIKFSYEASSSCDHVWGDGEVTTAATCTTTGVRTYTCSKCGETKTEVIAALGHTWGSGTVHAATCTEGGYTEYECSVCHETKHEDETAALGHNYEDGICTVCGAEEPKEVTFAYPGGSSTNMTGNNDAATLGANASNWSAVGYQNSNQNFPGLNTDGSIRLYGSNQNYIVFKTLAAAGTRYLTSVVVSSSQANFDLFEGEAVFTSSVSPTGTAPTYTYTLGSNVSAFTIRNNSSTQTRIQSITVSYEDYVVEATTIQSVSITGAPQSEVTSATKGNTASLTAAATNDEGSGVSTFTWASSNAAVATVAQDGVVTYVGNGTTTITATSNYPAAENGSNVGSVSITISNLKGSETNPYTIAEARAIATSTANNVCVSGIIYDVESYNSTYHSITYWLSDNGTGEASNYDGLKIYGGKGLDGADFSAASDLTTGSTVVVQGDLQIYQSSIYEFGANSVIKSITLPKTLSSIAVKTAPTKTAYKSGEAFDSTGLVITATYSDTTEEDIPYAGNSGSFSFSPSTITAAGNVTITFRGQTCTQAVTLITVTNVTSVASAPSEVYKDESINPADVTLNVTYSDSSVGTVHPDIVTCDTSSTGTKTATATYNAATGTKSATFEVTVVNAPVYDYITDAITHDDLTATGTAYTNFSGVTKTSNAVYKGNTSLQDSTKIGFRSATSSGSSQHSGIISTTSGGLIYQVTTDGFDHDTRVLDVYGSNTAYTDPNDLWDANLKGTKLGSISKESQALTITGDYTYVGVRSNDGAIKISSISFVWKVEGASKPLEDDPVLSTGSAVNVEVGKTVNLTITTDPIDSDEALTVTSSNTSYVTITGSHRDYVIHAVALGSATVTVAGVEGHYSSSVTVTVIAAQKNYLDKVLTTDTLGLAANYNDSDGTHSYENVDYVTSKVCKTNGLQFQKTNGYLYNDEELYGTSNIKSITLVMNANNTNQPTVYEGTTANPDTEVTVFGGSFATTGVNTYKFTSGNAFFKIEASSDGATNVDKVIIEVEDSASSILGEARSAASAILNALKNTCGSGNSGVVTQSQWDNLSSTLTGLNLSSSAKDLLKNAERIALDNLSQGGAEIENAMAHYDACVTKFGFTPFTGITSASARASVSPISLLGDSTNTVAIIVVISMVSVTAIGGYFFLKKRREQN